MKKIHFKSFADQGLAAISRAVVSDERGSLTRIFCREEFDAAGYTFPVAQINFTQTHGKGTIRGLHFQHPPHAETKVITCVEGEVFDIALDLRPSSKTYLHFHSEILSSAKKNSLLIPPGFAHGFQTLTESCCLLYLHSTLYAPSSESGIRFDDPFLKIPWPLEAINVSSRDKQHQLLSSSFPGVSV